MKKVLTLVFILNSFLLYSQTDINKMLAKRDSIFSSNLGKQYLDFTITTLGNETITEQILQGKVTLLNFWFTGCAPCVAEFDALNELYEKYKDNPYIQLISITRDTPEQALETVEKHQLKYPVCFVGAEECKRLSLNLGFPTNVVIDQAGKIIYLKSGGPIDKVKAEKQIQELEQKMLEVLNTK